MNRDDLKKIKKKYEQNKKDKFFKEYVLDKNTSYNDKLTVTKLVLLSINLSINYHQLHLYYLHYVINKYERSKKGRTVVNSFSLYKNLCVFLNLSTSGLFTTDNSIGFDFLYYDRVLPIRRKSILVFICTVIADAFFNRDRELRRRNNIINDITKTNTGFRKRNNIINNEIIKINIKHKIVGATGWGEQIIIEKSFQITTSLKNENELRFDLSELILNQITTTKLQKINIYSMWKLVMITAVCLENVSKKSQYKNCFLYKIPKSM